MSMPSMPDGMSRREQTRLIASSIVRVVVGLIAIVIALALVPDRPDSQMAFPIVGVLVGIGIYVWFFRHQLVRVRHSRYPYIQAIEALILVAAMFLAVFAAFYVMISTADPKAFTEDLDHFSAYYFALTVLATVGFGDITPVTVLARSVAMVQMAIDIVFIAVTVKIISSTAQKSLQNIADRNKTGRGTTEPSGPGAP